MTVLILLGRSLPTSPYRPASRSWVHRRNRVARNSGVGCAVCGATSDPHPYLRKKICPWRASICRNSRPATKRRCRRGL